jgi:cation:H+ antiporter
VGNLFGANTYNLVNIAILDFLNKGGPLLSAVSSGQLVTAALSLIPLSIAALGIFFNSRLADVSFVNVSLYSILILASYFISTRIIFKFEKRHRVIIVREEDAVFKYGGFSLKTASIRYCAAALVIAAAGIWLAYIGSDLAGLFGLGQNFIGSLFLGFATTLPEITVSITALRLGAKELAVANMLGSNLFNITIIFVNDVLYRKAPIFTVLTRQHIFTAFVVMLMTVTVIAGLILKPKKKTMLGFSAYAVVLIVIFLTGAYVNFILGNR